MNKVEERRRLARLGGGSFAATFVAACLFLATEAGTASAPIPRSARVGTVTSAPPSAVLNLAHVSLPTVPGELINVPIAARLAVEPIDELVRERPIEDLPRGWAPPTWFPEEARDALWSLEGTDGTPPDREPGGGPGRLKSRAAFVFDLDSGRVLLSRGADTRLPVASLTKVVTALTVASEAPDLDAERCIDKSVWVGWPGAGSKLRTGSCMTGWDILGAALVRSDNRAAYALATTTDLPPAPFVDRMNQVAEDIGMSLSSFSDPSGVEDENLSTARDMTRALIAATSHPVLAPVLAAPYWDVEDSVSGRTRRMRTTNRLLETRGLEFIGAKTGYTDTARHCFAAVVQTASGKHVALATLGARKSSWRWSDVRRLLSWADQVD